MPPVAQHWMSPEELGAYLGIPLASIYKWRYEGSGPRAYKIGRHLRFKRSDVEIWIEQHATDRAS